MLVATDGSDLAVQAARRGLELLGNGDVSVTVLSVVRPPQLLTSGTGPPVGVAVDPSILDREEEGLDEQGEAAVDDTAAVLPGVVTRRVEHGEPGSVICAVAAEEDADVVVVGSHGSGFLKRMLLGSVSHHVLHHAGCPVLVVRRA